MNKKLWITIGLIILTVIAILVYSGKREIMDSRPVVKIGVILPLTGNNQEVGNNVKNVIQLYVKENQKNYKIRYDIIIEDDAFRTANVATLAHKLVNVDRVDGLVTILAYAGIVASTVTDKAGVPHINIASAIEAADGKYSFVNYTPLPAIQERFSELFKRKGIKKLAIINMDHVGPMLYNKHLKDAISENKISYEEHFFKPEERDFRMLIQKIKENKPDIIIVMALPPSLDVLGKQIKELGIDIELTSVAFFSMSNNKELFEGFIYVDGPDGSPEFIKKINRELKTDNLYLLAFAHDTIKIYMDSIDSFYIENDRLPTREEIAEMLRNLKDFKGEGGVYSMGKDGSTQSEAIFKKIINGRPEIVK
ncbi:MAG: ABC transporter substrate-binding protein [Alphaproteobacteria bacterium]|nr:ABC transporter substrate-binding protein [Alphaproteobacteria bacterium]